VREQLTTPKNHQQRRIDLSTPNCASNCGCGADVSARRGLKAGHPLPEWVFSSNAGTALDESNVRKAFNRILDAAGLHRRGPHQMRHTFASLLLQDSAPITYVSQQLGHRDASMTLRVYAHCSRAPRACVPWIASTMQLSANPDATEARRASRGRVALNPLL
jgi:integrase